jgi:SPP1 family predicted phage head-tail adaptor
MAYININEMNRRITINVYLFGQDNYGGNTKSLIDTYDVWAKVTQQSGSRTLDQMQIAYNESYEIIKRYELSRPTKKNSEIVYENSILSIANVEEMREGNKSWERITAYTTGNNVSESTDIFYNWEQVDW